MAETAPFRAGLVQLRSGRSIEPNVEMATALIRKAAALGAEYVQTPENTGFMELDPEKFEGLIRLEQETEALAVFRREARTLGIWLHIGSLAVRVASGKAANRSFLIAPDGSIVARYDKIHMFDVDLPSGESYRESLTFEPGVQAVLAHLPWGVLGFTTCYDIRFPEQYKALALAGADFIAAPSAFTRQTGEAHWHILARARAIETGCYLLAAAQGGRHENGRTTFGHSMIVSPWGEILAEAGDQPCVITADINPVAVREARQRIPALAHAKPIDVSYDPRANS
jgi:deaminated glutathione amidase